MASRLGLWVSKGAFLRTRMVPANDNDAFNNNKCAYCWGPYDNDHPGVRVLPCNHVFGRDCLLEVIERSPTGNLCMICRTPLFQPPLWELLIGYFVVIIFILEVFVHIADQMLHYYLRKLPRWLSRGLYGFYMFSQMTNSYFLAMKFLDRFTDIASRNPTLNIRFVFLAVTAHSRLLSVTFTYFYAFFNRRTDRLTGSNPDRLLFVEYGFALRKISSLLSTVRISATLCTVPLYWYIVVRGNLRKEDRLLFISTFLVAITLNHIFDIWFIACSFLGRDAPDSWFGIANTYWSYI